ncbi:hypothetical protein Tco_1027851 [Tanacetum coccineum]
MKAQELKTKTSAQTLIYKIFLQRYQVYQGRLLASFQDDAKYEHVGQDTRSQGGKDDQDKQGKDLKISDIKTKSKDNEKGSRSKITKHEGTSLQRIQRPRPQDLNDKSNLIDLTKECHNELTSGEIVSLKILSRTMEVREDLDLRGGLLLALISDVCIPWSVCGSILMRTIPSGWICVISGVARVSTSGHTGFYWLNISTGCLSGFCWYAIVTDPLIHDSLITQFWSTASLRSSELGPPAIVATIDGTPYTITESLVRSQLQLQDEGEFTKSGSWDQFGSPLAIALICLCEGKKFLQMILDIETRHTKPYHAVRLTSKMFANMRLNFHGDHMPLVAAMLPPPQAAIAAGTSREAAPPNPQTDHETVTEPPVSTPPRPIPTSPSAQVNQSGPSSDPHVESSSKDNASILSLVSEQRKKIESLESGLQAHKLLFKDVMGKLVKRVKFLESKLKARGRNVILSESDKEEDEEQDVDSLIKLAKAAAIAADTSSVPADATQETDFPPSSSIHTDAFVHGNVVPTGTASDFSADPSNKGKSPMVEEDPPIKERSFRQMEEDRLGAEAARKLYEEEKAELAREQEEMKKKRQEDVLKSAKYYNDADWSDIMGQVHANTGLTADLLGPDVNEDNFAARMAAIIAERRRKFAAQSSTIYTTGWTLKHVRSFSDDQLKVEFDKIRNAAADLQSQTLRRSLKRPGADLDQHTSKKSKSNEAQHTSVPPASNPSTAGVPSNPSPFVDTPPHSPEVTPISPPKPSDAAPSAAASHMKFHLKMSTSEVDLNAPVQSFIHVLSEDDSDDESDDYLHAENPLYWHAFAVWEVVTTGLGDINALYFTDKLAKYFTHLREVLHLLDRQDLSKLFGMVVKYYEDHPLAGSGMILWGDLHVLFESSTGGSSSVVWDDQQKWILHSWKLFPFSGVHVLETFHGKILYMFTDTPYPLSASLMKKMLKHKLEVEIDGLGNDMMHAEQLILFIKKQLASLASPEQTAPDSEFMLWNSLLLLECSRYVVPTGRVITTDSVIVATSGYVVPAAYDISPGLKDLSRAETYSGIMLILGLLEGLEVEALVDAMEVYGG